MVQTTAIWQTSDSSLVLPHSVQARISSFLSTTVIPFSRRKKTAQGGYVLSDRIVSQPGLRQPSQPPSMRAAALALSLQTLSQQPEQLKKIVQGGHLHICTTIKMMNISLNRIPMNSEITTPRPLRPNMHRAATGPSGPDRHGSALPTVKASRINIVTEGNRIRLLKH